MTHKISKQEKENKYTVYLFPDCFSAVICN